MLFCICLRKTGECECFIFSISAGFAGAHGIAEIIEICVIFCIQIVPGCMAEQAEFSFSAEEIGFCTVLCGCLYLIGLFSGLRLFRRIVFAEILIFAGFLVHLHNLFTVFAVLRQREDDMFTGIEEDKIRHLTGRIGFPERF